MRLEKGVRNREQGDKKIAYRIAWGFMHVFFGLEGGGGEKFAFVSDVFRKLCSTGRKVCSGGKVLSLLLFPTVRYYASLPSWLVLRESFLRDLLGMFGVSQ